MSSLRYDVMNDVSSLGISVERGSSTRAWVKATYLYIEHYVLPVVPKPLIEGQSNLKQIVACQLYKAVVKYPQSGSSVGKLPTKKSCLSVKRLKSRHSSPVHSCLKLKDYNLQDIDSPCLCCDSWKSVPSLLVGYFVFDESGNLTLKGSTGSITCLVTDVDSSYANTICVLPSWNYICSSKDTAGYVELLKRPVVLINLDDKACCSKQPTLPVEKIQSLQKKELAKNKLFNISGVVYSVICDAQSVQTVQLVEPTISPEDRYSCKNCTIKPNHGVTVHLQRMASHPKLFNGFQVILFGIEFINSGSEQYFQATSQSWIEVTGDIRALLDLHEQNKSNSCEMPTDSKRQKQDSYKTAFFPVYIGRIESIESCDLGIMLLEDNVYLVLKTDPPLGFRAGALISIKKVHGCKWGDSTLLVCCKNTQIQVLEFSSRPSPHISACDSYSTLTEHVTKLSVHPLKLVSWHKMAKSIVECTQHQDETLLEDHVNQLLRQTWVLKLLSSFPLKQVNEVKTAACEIESRIQQPCEPFQYLSIKEVHSKVLSVAKHRFATESKFTDPDQWGHCLIPSDQLFDNLQENAVMVGQLQHSNSGILQVCDGASFVPCILLPESIRNNTDQFFVPYNIPSTGSLMGLLQFVKFSTIVERRWVDNVVPIPCEEEAEWTSSSQENEFLYSVCFVVSAEENSLLKAPKKSMPLSSVEEVASTSCSVPDTNHKSLLLFVTHKCELQEKNSKTSFNITAFILNVGNYCDHHIEFSDEASSWFSFVFPGTMLHLELDDPQDSFTCIKQCHIKLIRNCSDLQSHFNYHEVQEFYKTAMRKWKATFLFCGLEKVCTVDQVLLHPHLSSLVSLRAVISHRVLYKDHIMESRKDFSTRLDLISKDNASDKTISLYIGSNCSASKELGLVPGTTVVFYRVKPITSKKGFVYCKFTPTSFYIIDSYNKPKEAATSQQGETVTIHKDVASSSAASSSSTEFNSFPVSYLYDLYVNEKLSISSASVFKLKANVTRLLSVELQVVCAACGRQRERRCGCPASKKSEPTLIGLHDNVDGYEVSLDAKAMITDGSGRAILQFTNQDHVKFCALLNIANPEWNDVISLLRQSSSGIVSYDCDVNDRRLVSDNNATTKSEVDVIATALFDDLNSRCFWPRELIVRKQRNSSQPKSKTETEKSQDFPDPRFKVGTMPVDDGSDTSQRCLSFRLVKFNCVEVL